MSLVKGAPRSSAALPVARCAFSQTHPAQPPAEGSSCPHPPTGVHVQQPHPEDAQGTLQPEAGHQRVRFHSQGVAHKENLAAEGRGAQTSRLPPRTGNHHISSSYERGPNGPCPKQLPRPSLCQSRSCSLASGENHWTSEASPWQSLGIKQAWGPFAPWSNPGAYGLHAILAEGTEGSAISGEEPRCALALREGTGGLEQCTSRMHWISWHLKGLCTLGSWAPASQTRPTHAQQRETAGYLPSERHPRRMAQVCSPPSL